VPVAGAPEPGAPPGLDLRAQFSAFARALPASVRGRVFAEPDGENRTLTVLFVDLSGSVAATAHLDPEATRDRLNEVLRVMVDAVLGCGGRIGGLQGDGVLAFFGTPVAHENDPERAVLAALAVRDALRRLGLASTAGIATGEAYVGAVGPARHQEFAARGLVINLAARLQARAAPGQVLVGGATYQQTRRAFEFRPRSFELKGFAGRVAAYEVVRRLPRPEKVRGIEGLRAALIGRDDEMGKLVDALAAVRGGEGRLVSLIGEAGVGKSRLVAELKRLALGPADADGPTGPEAPNGGQQAGAPAPAAPVAPLWLEGRCLDLGVAASYWPFIDVLRALFAVAPEDDERARGGRVAAALRGLVADGALSAARGEEVGPVLGHLLGARFGTAWDGQLAHTDPEQVKHQTFLALRDLLLALAKRRPVALVLEDLHWADGLSLDVVPLLMEALTVAPLLLVCVYRPDREHRCWHLGTIANRKCGERYTELHLRELTAPQARRLVEALLRIDRLPQATKDLILARAQGNPFFVEEVVRALIDAGHVYRGADGGWRAREGVGAVAVPDTVQSVILSRVDRLEQGVKGVLQGAAVIGRLFRRRLLARVAGQEEELERALGELEDRSLIYEERAVPEEEYAFQHVLTQETVYQSILRRRRAAFHRQVAEATEALYRDDLSTYYEQLAHHYEQAGAWERALDYLTRAGDKAHRAYALEDARDFYARALALCERLGDAALRAAFDVARKRADVTPWPAKGAEIERLSAIARRLGDGRYEGLALAIRGSAESHHHDFEAAEESLRAALAVGDGEGYDDVRLHAHLGLRHVSLVLGRLADALTHERAIEALIPKVNDPAIRVPGDAEIFHNWAGRFDAALAVVERRRPTAVGDLRAQTWLAWTEALVRGGRGEYQAALALLAPLVPLCERVGDFGRLAYALNLTGWVYGEVENHERALEWNTRGIEVPLEHGFPHPEHEHNARLNLGDNLLALGRPDEAEAQFRIVERTVRRPRPQDRWMLWRYAQHLFHSYGELWLARGDPARALAYADDCLRLAEPTESKKNVVKARRLRGQALLTQGKPAAAASEVATALRVAREVGNPPQLWKTLAALGELRRAQGRAGEAREAYGEALGVIERVAAGLTDEALRATFLASPRVQAIRQLAQPPAGRRRPRRGPLPPSPGSPAAGVDAERPSAPSAPRPGDQGA
jgi:class 3 adenylate cyclase/tetratricopeptide (TPR) repeat protein